jgi:3-oxoacyl-[acyl-carrier-protein] synthase-3
MFSQGPGDREAMQIRISGTGRALPQRSLSTSEIEGDLGLKLGSLMRATGVATRHVCTTETQVSMAIAAGQAALQDAGLAPGDIGLVIFGSAVPYQPIPATAPLVMRGLGIADGAAAAFDVNSTCLSFLTAFEVAAHQIGAGEVRHALVVSSEIASRALPWATDPETASLFGDGAAAAVLSRSDNDNRLVATLLRTFPSAYEACSLGAGGTRFDYHQNPDEFATHSRFAMDGKTLFRLTALHFRDFVDDLLARAGWRREDVDLVVPHQASPAALAHMVRQCGFRPEQAVTIAADVGNQIAASIPFALDVARKDGRLRDGSKVILLGTSAGVSFGGIALVL